MGACMYAYDFDRLRMGASMYSYDFDGCEWVLVRNPYSSCLTTDALEGVTQQYTDDSLRDVLEGREVDYLPEWRQ